MQPSRAPHATVSAVSSLDAYVLPNVFVKDREVVSRGQDLLEIERGPARCTVRSSVPGVISRCRVHVGDAVVPSTAMLSIVRADDVLVVARFELSARPSLQNGKAAFVRIPRARAKPLAATLIYVTGLQPCDASAARPEKAAVRVVARLHTAPPDALWPGVEAIVDVQRDE